MNPPDGLVVAWLPVNRAWGVLWGVSELADRIVLRIFTSKAEAEDYADELRRPATHAQRKRAEACG